MSTGRVIGIILMAGSAVVALADTLKWLHRHPHRWLAVLIVAAVVFVVGLLLTILRGRKPAGAPSGT